MPPVKIAAQRPHYLPDFYFFYKIFYSDKFLISDFLGFRKQSPIVRADFGDFLLTVPVQHPETDPHPPITEIKMMDQKLWKDKHLKTLKSRFSSLPFFEHYFPNLVDIYQQDIKSLNQFLVEIILWQLELVLPDKNIQVCSKTGINSLETLGIWLQKIDDFQWCIYQGEKGYYSKIFSMANLVELGNISPDPFPLEYKLTMPLLVLLFLKGPETIIYFN